MTVVANSEIRFLAPQRRVTRLILTALTLCIATTASSAVPSLKAVSVGSKQLQLGVSYDLGYSLSKSAGAAEALSLTHGDFNTDGFQDLVSGYATDTGGIITLHRGNEEAYAPSTAASFAGLKQGVFPQGFSAHNGRYRDPCSGQGANPSWV